MYNDLKGKTSLITGSGKRTGIGYAIAEKLASCGSNIVIADLGRAAEKSQSVPTGTLEEMEEIAASLKKQFEVETLAVEVDVCDGDSIRRMMGSAADQPPPPKPASLDELPTARSR